MKLDTFDALIREWLDFEAVEGADNALNGLQVGRSGEEIKRVAFAVDGVLESFHRAVEWQADLLFVHHGLFWGKPLAITAGFYQRIKVLMEGNCALYAVHLPLDRHPELGNNAGIAQVIGLNDLQPFGIYKGVQIGYKGHFATGTTLDKVVQDLGGRDVHTLPFGPETIRSAAVVSGGAAAEVLQAIDEGLDLYITGDSAHTFYHDSLEAKINVIFGGHYLTEIWGVKQLAQKLQQTTDLETIFIDIPTGL